MGDVIQFRKKAPLPDEATPVFEMTYYSDDSYYIWGVGEYDLSKRDGVVNFMQKLRDSLMDLPKYFKTKFKSLHETKAVVCLREDGAPYITVESDADSVDINRHQWFCRGMDKSKQLAGELYYATDQTNTEE